MKRISLIALALAMAAAAAPRAFADGETIAVLTKNQTNPFFQAERIGAAKAAAEHARQGAAIRADPARQHPRTDEPDRRRRHQEARRDRHGAGRL